MSNKSKGNIVQFNVDVGRLLNIAYKKIDKSDYLTAVPILKKALKEEPENIDVLLELATIYSKINIIDVSNRYAYAALALNHNEMSLFIIGNNFMKMHNYKMGSVYFKRLLDMYPDGDYADYVDMVLERVEEEDMSKEIKLMRLTQKGKDFIEKEQYKKAIRLFSMVSTAQPEQIFIKNNLAMAYFYDGQPEKAIKICKEILLLDKYDIYANCNLALFYYKLKNKYELKRQLEKLEKLDPSSQEDFIKIISTYCEIKSHNDVIRITKQAILNYSCDLTYLFFLASANYNLGRVNKALSVYHDILKIDEDNYIAHYYIKAIGSMMKPKHIDYYHQLPMVAVLDCVKKLRSMFDEDPEVLATTWSKEDRLTVIWGIRYKDYSINKIAVKILENIGDEKSVEDLKNFLFSTTLGDDIKKDILAALQLLKVPQPYPAFFAGDIIDVKVSLTAVNSNCDAKRPKQAIDIFNSALSVNSDEALIKECIDMYIMILNKDLDKHFPSLNALCAVIEIAVREMYQTEYSKSDLLSRYHTTDKTVEKYGNTLAELLMQEKVQNLPPDLFSDKSDENEKKDE